MNPRQESINRLEDYSRKLFTRFITTRNENFYMEHPDYIDPLSVESHCDLFVTGTTEEPLAIELKFRFQPSNAKCFKEGYLIENDKIKELRKIYKTTAHRPYYVNMFLDGKIIIWDINTINFPEKGACDILCDKYTISNDSAKKVKDVYYLTEEEGVTKKLDLNDTCINNIFKCIREEIRLSKLFK